MPFRKMDGSTAWEFYAKWKAYILEAGDELIKSEGHILVKRKGKDESTGVFETN